MTEESTNESGAASDASASAAAATTLADVKAEADATAAELAKHEAQDRQAPKPSIGRIVLVRREHHGVAPAIITAVREDGTLDLQVFHADHIPHVGHAVTEA